MGTKRQPNKTKTNKPEQAPSLSDAGFVEAAILAGLRPCPRRQRAT